VALCFNIKENIIIECFALITLSFAFDVSGHVCTTEECAASGGVYTTEAWAASEGVCTTEECPAPGGVCHKGLSWIWKCLHYRGMRLIHRDQSILTVERVCFALKMICLLSDLFASLQKEFIIIERGINVIIWYQMLSCGINVIMLGSYVIMWDEILSCFVIMWCYHGMLLWGMITPPHFIFPKNFTDSLFSTFCSFSENRYLTLIWCLKLKIK
jgi:hypothetical protein